MVHVWPQVDRESIVQTIENFFDFAFLIKVSNVSMQCGGLINR